MSPSSESIHLTAPYCSIVACLSTAWALVILTSNRVARLAAMEYWTRFGAGGLRRLGGRSRQAGSV